MIAFVRTTAGNRRIMPWSFTAGLGLASAALLLSSAVALAQGGGASASGGTSSSAATSSVVPGSQTTIEQYWTPQRLLNAKPMELYPPVGADGLPIAPQGSADTSPSESGSGAPPSVEVPPSAGKVLIPPSMLPEPQAQSGDIPGATSSFGAYFTTSRVFPNKATKTYPYRTAGKLFFTKQGVGDFVCSASVLRPRIVVTAGHCVAQASTDPAVRHFYTNWLFIPA
jgi:V8-like Glu-specific endopeptidase